ncbi:hypothetical protein B0H16DRAFT_1465284 [Mycena metata]|uniref:Uncharacterized protein n=1 Tax=Mycena metata TaxID=1033252 RepID=A0AAD7MZS5_9AGAR|nr:hypothetical protein B0H16DRAFT_1465284 [Mycena metata]
MASPHTPSVESTSLQYFDGHILNSRGVFGVHYGNPSVLLDIPLPEEAPAPTVSNFRSSDFRRPSWINPNFPQLLLLPRSNPFYGPIFSCLNFNKKTVHTERVETMPLGDTEPRVRWGLQQDLIDRWLHLESLLLLTLHYMTVLHGGSAAEGVYTFPTPIHYCYTERNANSPSDAIKVALNSRDAFLPLMAHLSLMFLLLEAKNTDDGWRQQLNRYTRLPWQWIGDLEASAVGDFTIERLGGIIDLTQSKSHPDHRIPQHVRWLLPYLLGKHLVPLYFFYGHVIPPTEPIPDALLEVGFVPTIEELAYLRSRSGAVTFSSWSVINDSVWKRRSGAHPSTSSLSPSAPTLPAYDSQAPFDSPPTATYFPAVERDSGQKRGEDIHAFMERRRLHNEKRAQHESPDAKSRCLAQERHASKGAPPGKKGARVFIWEEEEGFYIRHACNRIDTADLWDNFTPAQRVYDSFSNQWDLCTALAPDEEAEPDQSLYDVGDDDDFFPFHPPDSQTPSIPSAPDVPGREVIQRRTGERAVEVLERAYDLHPDDPAEDPDNLPGWQKQDVLTAIRFRFGFEEPITNANSSPQIQNTPSPWCSWCVGDANWAVPETSALPTLLQHILQSDLQEAAANLSDMTSAASELALGWDVAVTILNQGSEPLYELCSLGSESSEPSILLESAATVLQVVRSGWGGIEPTIRNLVRLGAAFSPGWPRPTDYRTPLAPHRPTLSLGCRTSDYRPTLVDFAAYVQRRDAFVRSSRGRTALFYGGIVGRIACLVLSDFEDVACLEPSEDVLQTGARVSRRNGEGELHFETLTKEEINLICGVYTIETGQKSSATEEGQQLKFISWWPTPPAFYLSGLNTGWWNANCERWFVKRLKDIHNGQATLMTYTQWKNKIRFNKTARKVTEKLDKVAAQYLAARFA